LKLVTLSEFNTRGGVMIEEFCNWISAILLLEIVLDHFGILPEWSIINKYFPRGE
jgi:hypothetical protein